MINSDRFASPASTALGSRVEPRGGPVEGLGGFGGVLRGLGFFFFTDFGEGPRGRLLGGPEGFWYALGASWGFLGASWGRLGGVVGPLGASWGRLGNLINYLAISPQDLHSFKGIGKSVIPRNECDAISGLGNARAFEDRLAAKRYRHDPCVQGRKSPRSSWLPRCLLLYRQWCRRDSQVRELQGDGVRSHHANGVSPWGPLVARRAATHLLFGKGHADGSQLGLGATGTCGLSATSKEGKEGWHDAWPRSVRNLCGERLIRASVVRISQTR